MSRASDALDAVGIYNPHHLVAKARDAGVGPDVYIDYRPQQNGRAYQSAAWQVIRPGYKTDPNGHWQDYGHKTFDVFGADSRQEQLQAAIRWANERYGPQEWVQVPGLPGAMFPRPVAQFARDLLRAAS